MSSELLDIDKLLDEFWSAFTIAPKTIFITCYKCNRTFAIPREKVCSHLEVWFQKEMANRSRKVEQGQSQGLCETTSTQRFVNVECKCPTYPENLGPCTEFFAGSNGRCVYCDHTLACHHPK
jgi:hypothetical protein